MLREMDTQSAVITQERSCGPATRVGEREYLGKVLAELCVLGMTVNSN